MANRYWVGGSGTWNTTSTTNWSASSGGASGASVPTAADSVFFDQAATYTVTMTGALTCLDITVSAGTVTFATGTSPTLAISGSMSLVAGTVWSSTGAITFNATTTGKTITTNGVSLAGRLFFNGVGGYWTLGSALTSTNISDCGFGGGTFDTGGFAFTVSAINLSLAGNARTIKLNNSTVTLSNGASVIFLSTVGTLTFDAGTSQINLTNSAANINNTSAVPLTFYNVAFTSTTSGTRSIQGANTFNNLAVTAPSAAGVATVTFDSKQTINGTLSTTGTAGNRRVFFASATYGISVDLAVNSAPSLTDADFRGIYVTGTSAPISGTRIGNRGECRNITFSTPKTVYWNLGGSAQWSSNGWAATSGGTVNTDNFPLPQDTAIINNAGAAGTLSPDMALCNVDLSARTSAFTMSFGGAVTCYGNWTNGSGVTFTGNQLLTFSGGTTQTITSAGKTFSCPITVDTYGGTVQLADALNIGSNSFTVTNGTYDTKGYNHSSFSISSNNSNVRTIKLGASTVTLGSTAPISVGTSTNLTFDAGTSTINLTGTTPAFAGNGLTFYNVSFTSATVSASNRSVTGANTFNNLTFTAPSIVGVSLFNIAANQTINGTLTCAGASAVRRIFVRSDAIGTQRDLTVGTLVADDCDFRDIDILGTAAGTAPTRAGDCGGNAGITFPAAKTVYWNLAGAQNWSATGWATSSGGTPAANNFPLAQDTAVFDNTGSVTGTITIDAAWNIGTFDASNRTSAMTLTIGSTLPNIYGDWKFGTGVTNSVTSGQLVFCKNGTQTITSNGVSFGCGVGVFNSLAVVQLNGALAVNVSAVGLQLSSGTFDAVSYNVTTPSFLNNATTNTLKMGSGTWTLSGTGTVWNCTNAPTLIAGTSTIVLSDTSTTARTFAGGNAYYNKLTIGGTTGTSTLTITGGNTFGELASTKTVAHTIIFPSNNTTTIGKWSVTGTSGNVVTLSPSTAATTYTLSIAGPATTGVDWLLVSYCAVSATSPGEFYVGANTAIGPGGGNTGAIIFSATPTPRTLYWVGGTGNWSSTTKWSTSSGGASGAAIPTSLDAVVFDSASNATAYTATIDAGVTIARCASFTMAGPASGNVTFAGTVPIAFHGNVSFAATGITRTYTGDMQLAGNSSYTFTTNGLALASLCTVNGVGSTWTLGSALNIGGTQFVVTCGTFSTSASNYALTTGTLASSTTNVRSISLNGSTITLSSNIAFSVTTTTNLTFTAGTSTLSFSATTPSFSSAGLTFYNVSFTSAAATGITITGANTFNTLSFAGRTTVGITPVTFSANQTITTLTLNAGTAAAYRTFLASDTIGTQRTLTVTTLTAGAADYDFRDIAIAGGAAPISGTRFGDCKGNSGITFPAAKTVYWAVTPSSNWGAVAPGNWSDTNGGARADVNFPLAQDTAVFPSSPTPYPSSGNTVTINANYNIGTIDMSARTTNTMTLATGTTTPQIYGNWINGTGTTLSGSGTMTFAGRGAQTITSAGKTFNQNITINTPGGSVTLQDALSLGTSGAFIHRAGTFNADTYNVTSANTGSSIVSSTGTNTRTLAFGSGQWSIAATGSPAVSIVSSGLTVTGTGTISLTSAIGKVFAGGGVNYSGITLNQGGAGDLFITGNNTFKAITNSYSATGATSISLGSTTQTLTNPWTATGAAGNVLTVSGTSAASPGTLIFSGSGTAANVDYLTINNVRAYDLTNEWYAGANSTNGGSLGWYFVSAGGTVYAVTITETGTGTDAVTARVTLLGTISETGTGTDTVQGGIQYLGTISETGTGTDSVSGGIRYLGAITETATGSDVESAILAAIGRINETATGTDTDSAKLTAKSTITETATGTDAALARATFLSAVSESSTASDLISAVKAYLVFVSENATGTDAVSAAQAFRTIISEAATGTDVISALASLFSQVSESATGADSFSALAVLVGQISESATATEIVETFRIFLVQILESAAGADAVSARATFKSQIAESSTAQDIVRGFLVAATQITESATGSDQISALRTLAAAVVESVSGLDTVSAKAVFRGILQEIATLTDSVNAPGSTYNAPVLELATLQDAVRAAATFPVSTTDTATGTDAVAPRYIANPAVSESATITDVTSALAAFAALTAESASITDQATPPGSVYNPVVLAVATALDSVDAPGSIYNPVVLASATATDSLIGGFLWNLIDDAQTPGWGSVGNAQSAGWGVINNAQTSGWNLITPVSTFEIYSGWSSSATDGNIALVLNGLYTTGSVTPYAYNTQNGTWLYKTINGANLSCVKYVNGKFYAYSTQTANQLFRSTDGINWTQLQAPNTARPVRAVFGNGTQLIIQQNSTQIYLSTNDGASWTTNTISQLALSGTGAVWDGSKYVYNNGRAVYTSTDGATWTLRLSNTSVTPQRGSVARNGNHYVSVAQGASSGTGSIFAYSTNGITWSTTVPRPSDVSLNAAYVFNFGDIFAVACKSGSFYAFDPVEQTFSPLGTNTGYIYENLATGDFAVSLYKGQYLLPAYNLTAINQLPTSTNLLTFVAQPVDFWDNLGDSQNPNWQNNSTLN